ncbi:hypothetical protein RFI_28761 [Reticulomyxa filosa]|uniref:Uncharacterized protein n=1 Tax=Reticulomyxa filosa TaxID=46433 RepID=X6M3S4_RETFI|nr:hypothetical protein RFI_28761 [Reticulomyxa filosa]|eukprot:ETO08628.1 hypothetical protein RFI_28761 [Reticulomyxa filosa]
MSQTKSNETTFQEQDPKLIQKQCSSPNSISVQDEKLLQEELANRRHRGAGTTVLSTFDDNGMQQKTVNSLKANDIIKNLDKNNPRNLSSVNAVDESSEDEENEIEDNEDEETDNLSEYSNQTSATRPSSRLVNRSKFLNLRNESTISNAEKRKRRDNGGFYTNDPVLLFQRFKFYYINSLCYLNPSLYISFVSVTCGNRTDFCMKKVDRVYISVADF